MSEDESRQVEAKDDDSDEVEAHQRVAANDEAGDEGDDDEVEAHSRQV
jgi:hypothetical protein